MKKLTSLLISCSLLLTGVALAEKSGDQPDPKHKKGKGRDSEEKAGANEGKPSAPVKSEVKRAPAAPRSEKREAPKQPNTRKSSEAPAARVEKKQEARKIPETPAAEKSAAAARKQSAAKRENEAAKAAKATEPTARTVDTMKKRAETTPDAVIKRAKVEKSAETARSVEATKNSKDRRPDTRSEATANRESKSRSAIVKRPAPAKIKEIRARHENFRAEARPDRVPTVTFQESRQIENSDRWEGRQYEVFRSYRPERHDEHYYHSHYDRVELISGGYYYQSGSYWYPAWGYQPSSEYYAYDGPIYVGQRAEPLDRVIADVQDALQEMGYYKGEVDGLLGPLTRSALTGYQDDQGLQITAAIDEPTLDQLGLN